MSFDSFLNEVELETSVYLSLETLKTKLEQLMSTSKRPIQIFNVYGFGNASLLFGIMRTLSQITDDRNRIEQSLNLKSGVLIYLHNNFGNPTFIGSKQIIPAIPMNLTNTIKCIEYILYQQGITNYSSVVSEITQERVNNYYNNAEQKVQQQLEEQTKINNEISQYKVSSTELPWDQD